MSPFKLFRPWDYTSFRIFWNRCSDSLVLLRFLLQLWATWLSLLLSSFQMVVSFWNKTDIHFKLSRKPYLLLSFEGKTNALTCLVVCTSLSLLFPWKLSYRAWWSVPSFLRFCLLCFDKSIISGKKEYVKHKLRKK